MTRPLTQAELADELATLASEHLDIERERLVPAAPLADIGIDSFQLIELVFAVEERFDVRIELDKVRIGTFQDVLDLVCALMGERCVPAGRPAA